MNGTVTQMNEFEGLHKDILPKINPTLLGIRPTDENKAFLSNVLHNVKNPLGVLLGYSELLLDDDFDVPEEERIEYLNEE